MKKFYLLTLGVLLVNLSYAQTLIASQNTEYQYDELQNPMSRISTDLCSSYPINKNSSINKIASFTHMLISTNVRLFPTTTLSVDSNMSYFSYNSQNFLEKKIDGYFYNNQFTNTNQSIYSYNTLGNETEQITQKWQNGVWQNQSKYERTYTADSLLSEYTYLEWDTVSAVWVNKSKVQYIYNVAGKPTMATYFNYLSAWEPANRTQTAYDASGLTTNRLYQTYNNQQWTNTISDSLAYTTQGFPTQLWRKHWNTNTNNWEDNSRIDYTTDINGNVTLVVILLYNQNSGSYENSQKRTMTFDANNNTTSFALFSWQNAQWEPIFGLNYFYTNNVDASEIIWPNNFYESYYTKLDSTQQFTYDNVSGWTHTSSTSYRYATNIGINENVQNSFNCYPTPATDFIELYNSLSLSFRFALINTNGQPVCKGSSSATKTRLSTADIPSGNYFLLIETEEGNAVIKVLISH